MTPRNAASMLSAIRHRHRMADDEPVGVRGCFGADVKLKENGKQREIELTFNTDDIDGDNEVVVPAGADMTYFERNGRKVFADHEYGLTSVVGAARWVAAWPSKSNQKGWRARVGVMQNELGDAVVQIVKELGQIGTSIGFRPTAWATPDDPGMQQYKAADSIVTGWKMLEFSFTALPCNVSCQGVSVPTDESRSAQIEALMVKGGVSLDVVRALGVVHEAPKARRVVVWCGS